MPVLIVLYAVLYSGLLMLMHGGEYLAFLSKQGEKMVSSEPSNLRKPSSWRKDIQSLVKKCQILALYFFPKCRIGVEYLTRGRGGSEFTLTAA
jgi:hypothetical protein